MNSIISKMQTNNKFTEFIEDIKNKKGPIGRIGPITTCIKHN